MKWREKHVKHLLAWASQEEADQHGLVTEAVDVVAEDMGPGAGQITITCDGDAWNKYWAAMPQGMTISQFFRQCDLGYLCTKLAQGLESDRPASDEDDWTDELKRLLIERRRNGELSRKEARELWQDIEYATDVRDADLWGQVMGTDDWHYIYDAHPTELNPKYERLERVIRTVKMALECAGK